MKRIKKMLSLLLVLAMTAGLCGNMTAYAAEETNLALNRPTTASSTANNSGPELAVDGGTVNGEGKQWT